MKKRIIAFALCFVMLLGCLGMASDSLIADAPLYDRLIAAQTAEEFDAITAAATEDEIAALTDEQISALESYYNEFDPAEPSDDEEGEEYYPAPEFTVAGPLLGKSVSVSSNMVAANEGTSNTAAKTLSKLKSVASKTNNTPANIEENGVIMSKSSTRVAGSSDDDPIYQITLNAEAKSNIVNVSVPCDIVLVLDRSGSMGDNNNKNVNSLISSVISFLTKVQEMSPESRIAIVTYASDSTIDSGTKTSAGAFVPITKNGVVNSDLTAIVNGLSDRCEDGTKSNLGMKNAVSIFQAVQPSDANYNNTRATILFTDGIPGDRGWERSLLGWTYPTEDCGYFVAQESIHWGTILKANKGSSVTLNYNSAFYESYSKSEASTFNGMTTGCGSTVYCVGLNLAGYSGKNSDGAKINEYMYRVSSHRPDGSHVTDSTKYNTWESLQGDWTGQYIDILTRNRPEGSYYAVGDNSALNDIFTKIASQTGKPVENVVVRDYISEYFDICDINGNKLNVGDTVNTGEKTGTICSDEQGRIYVEWTEVTLKPEQVDNDGTVTEAAQTFNESLYVKPKEGFLGGNGVPTNGSQSAIYDGDAELAKFPEPTVDVPINADVKAVNKNIYLLATTPTADQLYEFDIPATEAWQTEFVNIDVKADKDISNTTDGNYTVTVTVSPKYSGTATEKTGTATATVNVFKPEITYRDSKIDLGQTPDYATENFGSVAWKHGNDDSETVTMTGTAPKLSYEYDPAAEAFQTDTYVNVTVKIGDSDITEEVTFMHNDCDYDGCKFDSTEGEFIVHIKTFDLTISKSGWESIDKNQSFVFNIVCADKNINMQVVIVGNDSVTIKGLPVGTYTITEDANWSWRYELTAVNAADSTGNCTKIDNGCTYTPSGTNNSILFTNSRIQQQWLSFVDNVKNVFQ